MSRTQGGKPSNDLTLSAHIGDNSNLFPEVLSLFVPLGSTVADVTYGKGVFWRNVPEGCYDLRATDLKDGVDCRELPYADGEIDCVVMDPPYMHTPGGTAHSNHQNFEEYYRNNIGFSSGAKYHEAVLDVYFGGALEAYRVLRDEGIYIVKCQDEVCANQQRLTHVEIINFCESHEYVCQDIFVLVSQRRPGVSRMKKQFHARKNHSYFLVFRKADKKSRWKGVEPSKRFLVNGGA